MIIAIMMALVYAPMLVGALLLGYRHDSNAKYYMNTFVYCAYMVAFYLVVPLDYLTDDLRGGFERRIL